MSDHSKYPSSFEGLYQIVSRLRSPEGCPWDRKQTPGSLKSALVEEVFECIDAIEKNDPLHVREELGDVMLLVSMIARIYEEQEAFTSEEIFSEINEKLIRRHPHVFGEISLDDPDQVVKQWDAIKRDVEGRDSSDSLLSGVPKNIPPLERSYHLQKKAAKRGFDWQEAPQVVAKLHEEIGELGELMNAPEPPQEALEEELGDILFSVVNLCRFMKFDPTLALHKTNKKFTRRFGHVERRMKEEGREISHEEFDRMDALWDEAKEEERRNS